MRADIVRSHIVEPAEVREWFECHRKPWPNEAAYGAIAGLLSRMRWGSDPPDSDRVAGEQPRWSAEEIAEAARLLHAMTPAMVKYWETRRASAENNEAFYSMLVLRDAIMLAMPHIEYLEKSYAKPKAVKRQSSDWHMQAIGLAHYVRQALIKAGHDAPRLSLNAPTIKIVYKALKRTKFAVKRPALAAYLSRREDAMKREAKKQDAKLRGMGMSLDHVTEQMALVKQQGDAMLKQHPEDFDPLWVSLGNI
jgi:hypothetical protein